MATAIQPAISVGNVVQLKSGGPALTVIRTLDADMDPRLVCAAFTEHGYFEAYMHPSALRRVG